LGATLVQVPVTVREIGGRYLIDLKKEDFKLFEDGVEHGIEFFGAVDEPFSVVLLIDSSGSTALQLEIIKAAAIAFLKEVRDQDQVAVISFNDSVTLLSGLTKNGELLRDAIQAIKPGEYTQVYEAVYTAVWEKLEGVEGRKAVIIFSDGIDTGSTEINEEDTLDAIIESEDVLVYPIRYNTKKDVMKRLETKWAVLEESERLGKTNELDSRYKKADTYLNELARLSGGVVEYADQLNDLKPALMRIARELRQQYLVGYYIADVKDGRRERRISVMVNRVGSIVRTRPSVVIGK
jgi:Ca-activated chloride channel family protein